MLKVPFTRFKADKKIFMKQETKNENKFGISLMRRNFIFGTSRANFRTPLVSHIFM